MKKILAQYPSVFYQILLFFLLEEICFPAFSFNLFQYSSPSEGVDTFTYISLITSTLYITSGFIIDKLEDTKKALHLGVAFLLLGFIIAIFALDSSFGPIGALAFLYFGHSIFFIYCIMHIGAFFPIANDWKDNAFLIFLAIPQILGLLFSLIFMVFSENLMFIFTSDNSLILIGVFFWALLLYLIGKFMDVGFSVSEEEEEVEEEKPNHRFSMIGLILVAIIFSFITSQLHNLGNADSYESFGLEGLLQSFGGNEFVLIDYALKTLLLIGIIAAMYFAKYYSTHFSKLNWIIGILFLMAGVELGMKIFGNYYLDFFVQSSYGYIYDFLLIPIFLSIITHVNLDKNLGLWIGILFAIPSLVYELQSQFLHTENAYYFAPFVAVFLLIAFFIVFRENREFLKEKLTLNESNREEDDEENGIDIMEHFVEE